MTKSNLRRSRGIILKIRSRERVGKLIHKSQISMDDHRAVANEVKLWIDKFGVPRETFRFVLENPMDQEELANVKQMMKDHLNEGEEKVKKAMSS